MDSRRERGVPLQQGEDVEKTPSLQQFGPNLKDKAHKGGLGAATTSQRLLLGSPAPTPTPTPVSPWSFVVMTRFLSVALPSLKIKGQFMHS